MAEPDRAHLAPFPRTTGRRRASRAVMRAAEGAFPAPCPLVGGSPDGRTRGGRAMKARTPRHRGLFRGTGRAAEGTR